MIQTKNVDVVISGAGPVGLFLAYDLSKKGHSVAIVDPKPGPTDQSRAILVTSRTMEILDGKGLASDVLKEAFISSGMRMIRNGSVVCI
jgi:2-polyprenyl-6-methoxyphenol hydroxylase-like FAD-dependent oxidoreductase